METGGIFTTRPLPRNGGAEKIQETQQSDYCLIRLRRIYNLLFIIVMLTSPFETTFKPLFIHGYVIRDEKAWVSVGKEQLNTVLA